MQKRDKISNELFICYSTNLLLSHTQYLMISFNKSHAYVQMNKSSKAITLNEIFPVLFFLLYSHSQVSHQFYIFVYTVTKFRVQSWKAKKKKFIPLLLLPSFSHHQTEWNDSNLDGIVYDILNVLAYGVI